MHRLNPHGCIAYPCVDDRVKGSGFCAVHKEEHKKCKFKIPLTKADAGRS